MSKKKHKVNMFTNASVDWNDNILDPSANPVIKDFNESNYNDTGAVSIFKRMTGGRKTEFPSYHYPKPKSQHLRAGSKIPSTENVKAPNGTHWQNETSWNNHYVHDYENSDIFSDFTGWFNLEKIGNKFHCWVSPVDAHVIDVHGKPGHEITHFGKSIANKTWVDTDKSKSFALASIAAYFAKHNIYEDNPKNGYPHTYHDVNMGCIAVKYWNIFDGGNDNSKPHIIAHKGENLIIDTGKMKVKKTDGTDLTKYTSFESDFPPLQGGQINNINFYPTVGKDCDVQVTYVPRIK